MYIYIIGLVIKWKVVRKLFPETSEILYSCYSSKTFHKIEDFLT